MSRFWTLSLGLKKYSEVLTLQNELIAKRLLCRDDFLVIAEHEPVITFGRGADKNLLISDAEMKRQGIDCFRCRRDGGVTFHGLGQIVCYPIVDLKVVGGNTKCFLWLLEEVLIDTLSAFNIYGERRDGESGVWVREEKIGSARISVRRGISWHGFSLNVSGDLSGISAIVPCSLRGGAMTSMERLLENCPSMENVEKQLIYSFAGTFQSLYIGEYYAAAPAKA